MRFTVLVAAIAVGYVAGGMIWSRRIETEVRALRVRVCVEEAFRDPGGSLHCETIRKEFEKGNSQ